MRNIKLVLEYEGTAYRGWQRQKEDPTVQSVVEDCVEKLTGEHCAVIGAGRTDSGVHALGQVAAFRTVSELDAATIKRALNALLPADIRVKSVSEADDSFHPRYSSVSKTYFYLIANTVRVSPFLRRYVWRVPEKLDLAVMSSSAKPLLGTHDFRAFMGAWSGVKNFERTLEELSVSEVDGIEFFGSDFEGHFIRIVARGDGFLRHMVRNIVGTMVEAGKGKLEPGLVSDILASGERTKAGPTAPAGGLFLGEVHYRQ